MWVTKKFASVHRQRLRTWFTELRADRKRFPTRWLTYTQRLNNDVDLYLAGEGNKELDKDYISDVTKSIETLEERQVRLIFVQSGMLLFLYALFFSPETSFSLLGLSIKDTPGLKELILVASGLITALVCCLSGAKDVKVAVLRRVVRDPQRESWNDIYALRFRSAFNIHVYTPSKVDDWIVPRRVTKLIQRATLFAAITVIVLYYSGSLTVKVAAYVYLFLHPTIPDVWSRLILLFSMLIDVFAAVWLVQMYIPLPYQDLTAVKDLAELEESDPELFAKRLSEVYGTRTDDA